MQANAQFAPAPSGPAKHLNACQVYLAAELEQKRLRAQVYERLRAERRAQFMRQLASLWPVAVGLLLGACAPALQQLIADNAPWAMPIVFPFVVLAGRPEMPFSGAVAQALPVFALYAQFPLEGLFVRRILRHRVTVSSVCGQVSVYHMLAFAQLWLVSGPLSQTVAR
jgi:hypothetical protein